MDRDEALRLLEGGPEGVAEWNRRREAGEEIPNLSEADLTGARLVGARLVGARLVGARLDGARCGGTTFANVDLSEVKGLDQIKHLGPSTIGIDTLFRSRGKIPEAFLRGCGVPESVIVNRFALVGALEPIQFHSCFISYSTKDEEFAQRLHARMVQEKLRVWFAPEDMKAGHYHDEQIERAIQVHDKLLLVLSEASMASAWVRREIRKARETEAREDRRKLFPIRLVGMEMVQGWECVDPRTGQDYAEEVLRYHIPDFSNWKGHDSFEESFARLLRDLKAEESTAK